MKRVCLHLGAHRTGTSYIQNALRMNRGVLEKSGVSISVPGENVADCLSRYTCKSLQDDQARGCNAVIQNTEHPEVISNENILSTAQKAPHQYLSGKGLGRLARLKLAFPNPTRITVFFTIRHTADFVESCYLKYFAECIRQREVPDTITGYLAGVPVGLHELSWRPVVEEMTAVFGDENVFVWEYDSVRANYAGMIQYMVRSLGMGSSHPLEMPSPRANVSLSGVSMIIVKCLTTLKMAELANYALKRLRKIDAKRNAGKAKCLSIGAREVLTEAYNRDRTTIRFR